MRRSVIPVLSAIGFTLGEQPRAPSYRRIRRTDRLARLRFQQRLRSDECVSTGSADGHGSCSRCQVTVRGDGAGSDGVYWQAFFLRWLPADTFYGRAKVAMSKTHNPTICLTAEGMKLETQLDPVSLPVRPGFNLIFDRYVFVANGRDLFVFFSQTEDMQGGGPASMRMTHLARLRAALAGSRNYGQINFEVALAGPETPADALRAFRDSLPELVANPATGP